MYYKYNVPAFPNKRYHRSKIRRSHNFSPILNFLLFNINIHGINVGVSFCCYIKCRSLHSCSHYDYIASGHHLCLTKILLKFILKHEKNYDNLCFFFPFSPQSPVAPVLGLGLVRGLSVEPSLLTLTWDYELVSLPLWYVCWQAPVDCVKCYSLTCSDN